MMLIKYGMQQVKANKPSGLLKVRS